MEDDKEAKNQENKGNHSHIFQSPIIKDFSIIFIVENFYEQCTIRAQNIKSRTLIYRLQCRMVVARYVSLCYSLSYREKNS